MILRDARQTTLDEAIVQCEAMAQRYRHGAYQLRASPWAQVFTVRGGQLERLAAQLGGDLRALEDLPGEPDPEQELVRQLLAQLQAALGADRERAQLQARAGDERALIHALEQARRAGLNTVAEGHVVGAIAGARAMLACLEDARG